MEGCEICPDNEDVWLEAARPHRQDQAKTILAAAARRMPASVKVYLRAADLESHDRAKNAVLRKALEANPNSVTLWKAAIDLEDADDAKVLLSVAVEKVPHSVEMWLALARLETYENARKVLNQARKHLPAERAVWIAAAKLEESQNHGDVVDRIVDKAVRSLDNHDAVVTHAQWLKEAGRRAPDRRRRGEVHRRQGHRRSTSRPNAPCGSPPPSWRSPRITATSSTASLTRRCGAWTTTTRW